MKSELLAPAGDFLSLIAAIKAGADAVYFGLKEFNMRDSAKNFKLSDLAKINKLCGKRVKKYLTLNTIIYDSELSKLEKIFKKLKSKVDAVICWDLSVISLCKKYKIPFHVSTQASISNIEAAKFYKKLGAQRVILARELNLNQIKKISKIIDIECFIHGAMCVSVSGRCFTSQFLFNRSANRGSCMHPCRRTYTVKDREGNDLRVKNSTIFSAKDLCTLPFIEKLKQAGIKSFKIEGRNRDARYVDTVVRVYKKALNKKLNKKEIEQGLNELNKVYNKGFSSGFFLGIPTSDDFTDSEYNKAKQTKKFVGRVITYLPKIGVAVVEILAGELKLKDNLMIIGNTTSIIDFKISSMEINKKKVDSVSKGQMVAIKLPKCRKNDEIYLIVKNKN